VPSAREQYLQALVSLSDLTRTQAERVAALLAKQGEVQSAQVNRVTEDLMRRTQKNREILTRLVQREVKRQLGILGMASRDEVARLQQRVRALEQEVERSAKAAPARPSAASASESSSAAAKPAARTRAASSGSAAKPATRAKAGSSGTAAKSSTRSRSAASAGSAKPATRTRTGGTSSRSAASSPGTRRRGGAKGSPGSGSGTSDTGSGSGG
jgi:polyhydroxyalkanoate synthesis regulator phasin